MGPNIYITSMSWAQRLREKARRLEQELMELVFAIRDPATPWYAKLLALGVLGYATSPIDLIPDFIPVLGYLDDLILVPLGIWLVVRMIPAEVMIRSRERAHAFKARTSARWFFAGISIVVWVGLAVWTFQLAWPFLQRFATE